MADKSGNSGSIAGGGAPPSQHDWEVLTMSVSDSAFGTPGSASVFCNCEACIGKASADGVPNPDLRLECCSLRGGAAAAELPAADQIESSGPYSTGIMPRGCGVSSTPRGEIEFFEGEHDKAIHESKPAIAASETDLFQNRMETSSANQGVNLQGEGRFAVSSSEPDPFTDGWKPRRGNLLILDRIPGALDAVNTFSRTRRHGVNNNPFEQDDRKSKVEEGVQKVPPFTEVGGCKIEGTNEVEKKSDAKGKKIANTKLGNFCNKALSTTWWKRQASLSQAQTQETDTFWSIAWTATVIGIVVVLGYRWQRERSQIQQLRLQLSAKDAELNSLVRQLSRLKEVVSGRHHTPVARF